MVCDRDFFSLNKEDALIGLRPHPIQTLNLVLSPQHCLIACLAEVVNGIHTHHLGCKNLLETPREFERPMSGVSLQHEPMPWILSGLQQPVDRNVQLGDIKLWHFRVLHLSCRLPSGASLWFEALPPDHILHVNLVDLAVELERRLLPVVE